VPDKSARRVTESARAFSFLAFVFSRTGRIKRRNEGSSSAILLIKREQPKQLERLE